MQREGIELANIHPGSAADEGGLQPGDLLVSVNSRKLRDPIDFMFYSSEEALDIEVKRNRNIFRLRLDRRNTDDFGMTFKPFKIMTCRNNCLFCFVKQLPRGLRKTLYVKDEDYRMSFLYGNYITMTNLSKEDRRRIVEQRLSPLYISVHSTNRALRNKLLGNTKAPDILRELKFLADNKLRFNAQIVVCPGYNDGKELQQTLSSLYRFYPYLLSVAVVPVGLTMYHKRNIRAFEKDDAVSAIRILELFQKRFMKKHGTPIVYGADELYLKAEIPFPPLGQYGELYQYENGVGMVPFFLSRAKKIRVQKPVISKGKFITFTGRSFFPFLKKFTERLEKEDIKIDVVLVENTFFGSSITVTGLLTGRDVMKSVLYRIDRHEMMLIPDTALNHEDKFLDDVTLGDVQEALRIPAKKISATPEGLLQAVSESLKCQKLLTD
ncbi:MAG: DUF512 domain-containing protein [Nitrospirota bacterium]